MAMFSRATREEKTDLESQGEEARTSLGRARGVGQVLREARQSFGREIPQIGSTLRIRVEYLEAIETGRYEQLPGPTYAIGFIRTYADYLGLDGAEIVRRFKQETEGLDLKRDLTFPMPLTERSIPGGTILLVALILALCGYGIWYYLSSANHARTERVSNVPSTLLPPASGTAAPGSGPPPGLLPPTEAAAAPPSAPGTTSSIVAPAPLSNPVPPTSTPASRLPAVSETTTYTATPAAPASSTTIAGSVPTTAASPLPPVPQQLVTAAPNPPPAPAATAAVPPAAAAPTTSSSSATPSAAPPHTVASLPPVPAVGAPADPSHLFGATTGPSRIAIRATGISWIQVRDAQGNELFTRVMKAGDVYRVPDKPGLQLHTGSAGSLEVSVDGKVAPTLGTVGVIRHTVVLDPARLLAGTAVEN